MITMHQRWPVLDHGYIELLDWMGTDESIIEAARTSTKGGFRCWGIHERCKTCGLIVQLDRTLFTPKNSCDFNGAHHVMEKQPGDENLLDYLWRHGHHTPFEMCELKILVKAPILVWRQWMRHRTQSFNEASARYAKMDAEHYLPSPERIKAQSKTNKQGSEGDVASEKVDHFLGHMEQQQNEIYDLYDWSIEEAGIANETARLNTPVSRYSTAVVKTDLRNWLHFLNLRMDGHAQWEIRQYANVIGEQIVRELWPWTWGIFKEHTLQGVHFSRSEIEILRDLLVILQGGKIVPSEVFEEEAQARGMSKSRINEFLDKLKKENTK